jgi:hypothetical protein
MVGSCFWLDSDRDGGLLNYAEDSAVNTDITARIALIVGVTGHRDIIDRDIPDIRTKICVELDRIKAAAKDVRPILLSGLAEGGDQLVAEEALKRNWKVYAIFPMPFADYLADFATDDKRKTLTNLKDRCADFHEIPWALALDSDITDPRDQQYRNQSIFIARQSQVVIALWDGTPANPKGACGASYVAELCRNGPPPIEGEVLVAPETTSLIHIPVKRQSAPDREPVRQPVLPSDQAYLQVCKEFGSYNGAVATMREANPQKIKTSKNWLMPEEALQELDPATRALIEQYACANALAVDQQTYRNQVVKLASIATLVGAFAQATNGLLAQTSWMIAYGIAVGVAYGLYLILFKLPFFRIEDRYLEYRALAESLRIQIFWRAAGVPADAAEHYLQLVKTEVGWIREALRSISLCASIADSRRQTAADVVKKFWIDGQIKYFVGTNPATVEGKSLDCKKLQKWLDFGANAALVVGVVLVAAAGAASLYPIPLGIKAAASAYSATFFLLAGVIKGYVAAMGYAEQAVSYEKMGAIFRGAQRLFEQDQSRRAECLFALGKHALAENAEWLMQHRKNAFTVQK